MNDLMQGDLFVPDQLLPSDNQLEIPSLRLDMQPKGCEIAFVCSYLPERQ